MHMSVVKCKLRGIDLFYKVDDCFDDMIKGKKIDVKLITPIVPITIKNMKF